MQALSRNRALAALACVLTAAFATPTVRAQPNSAGKILFTRPMSGVVDGKQQITGSAIFSIGDDGSGERQLTTYAEGVFNQPDTWTSPFGALENSTINAFSASGRYSVFLQAHSASLPQNGQHYAYGKYFVMNAFGQTTSPLFPGGNDLQPPKDGPSYGSVTWGPAGTDAIAYGNSINGKPVPHACVYLIRPDGTGNRKLWCARGYYPKYYQAIEGIRWSGDGKSLLVYAELRDPQHQRIYTADLYRVDVATGAGTLVQADVTSPLHGGGGDISYAGNKVLYETNGAGTCTPDQQGQDLVCIKNMVSGRKHTIVDPDGVLDFGTQQMLLTPDGSQAILAANNVRSDAVELYAVKSNGTGLRQLTDPCIDLDPDGSVLVIWSPVRVSPDGKQLLANCLAVKDDGKPTMQQSNMIYVVNLVDGSKRYITDGVAYDWHVPAT